VYSRALFEIDIEKFLYESTVSLSVLSWQICDFDFNLGMHEVRLSARSRNACSLFGVTGAGHLGQHVSLLTSSMRRHRLEVIGLLLFLISTHAPGQCRVSLLS
jgi:hypothetical protein